MSKPTPLELYEKLKPLVEWESFAIHLPGVRPQDVDTIKREKPLDIFSRGDQKKALLDKWLQEYPEASWQDVVLALDKLGASTLALSIRDDFITREVLTLSPSSSSSSSHSTYTLATPSFHEKPSLRDAFNLLQEKSAQWDKIGFGFGVPFNDQEALRTDVTLSNEARLERVINIWLETSCHTPVTWLELINVLSNSLGFKDSARQVQTFLDKEQSYMDPSDGRHSQTTLATPNLLQERPLLRDAFNLLQEKSAHWDEIGFGLDVPINDREVLRTDVSLSNEARLEGVIHIWVETSCHTPVTWLELINVLSDSLGFKDSARQVQRFLEHSYMDPSDDRHSQTSRSTSQSSKSQVAHINAFKEAVSRKGLLTCYITQCMPLGLPRVGKTCLYHRLLDRTPPGKPTTRAELGSGPESTNVLTKRRMIQVKIRQGPSKAIVAKGNQWNEVGTLQDEIAIYLKAVHSQQNPIKTAGSGEVSKSINPADESSSKPNLHATALKIKEGVLDTNRSSNGKSQLDDAILDMITRHGKVDLTQVQDLLDTSLTIFYTDTGGQPEFHEVLPALVAGPMIFMLAFNLCEPLEKIYSVKYASPHNEYESYESTFTVKEVLMQCLSSIVSYHDAQSRQCVHVQPHIASEYGKRTPPPTKILAIGTHSDLVTQEDLVKIDEAFKEAVADTVLEDKGMIEYFSREMLVIPINNYDPVDGDKIRRVFNRAVKREVEGVSPYKVELPVHWLGLELYLRQQKSSVVSYTNCLDVGKKLGMEEEEFSSCLWYLHHRMGTIRYYSGLEELQDTVITEPNILFVAVTEFIVCTFTLKNVGKAVQRSFHTLGLFKTSAVEQIFNKHKDRLQISFKQFIALLLHLNILGPAHDEEFDYFLPCALAHAPPFEESKLTEKDHDPLLASFPSGFVPKGVVSGVLANLCKRGWKIKRDHFNHRKPLLFRNQATFVVNGFSVTMTAKANHLEFVLECRSTDDVPNR